MPGDSLCLDPGPKHVPRPCFGGGTGPATHREDCGTCQCEYWDQQEMLIAQVLDELSRVQTEVREAHNTIAELDQSLTDQSNTASERIDNAWRVLAAMQKKLGGPRGC